MLVFSLLIQLPAFGYDVTDKFSIGGVLAGAYQYPDVKNDKNRGHGAFIFQPEFSFTPTDIDEIFAKIGFAAGNGLKVIPSITADFSLAINSMALPVSAIIGSSCLQPASVSAIRREPRRNPCSV